MDPGGTVRVVIADGLPLFRCGVQTVLSQQLGFEVVGEADDAASALALLATAQADVLLVDAALPPTGGLELLQRVAAVQDLPLTLLLCPVCGPEELEAALGAGARGALQRSVSAETLVKAIRSVAAGEYWFGRGDASEIVRRVRERAVGHGPRPDSDGLTLRERAIVEGVAAGHSNRAIASQLGIAEDTVKHHLTDVFDKLGLANRTELATWAARRGR